MKIERGVWKGITVRAYCSMTPTHSRAYKPQHQEHQLGCPRSFNAVCTCSAAVSASAVCAATEAAAVVRIGAAAKPASKVRRESARCVCHYSASGYPRDFGEPNKAFEAATIRHPPQRKSDGTAEKVDLFKKLSPLRA